MLGDPHKNLKINTRVCHLRQTKEICMQTLSNFSGTGRKQIYSKNKLCFLTE